jgi:hypothetical protein
MAYLTPEQIAKVEERLAEIGPKYNRLLLTFSHRKYSSDQAAEYARHGYLRRLGTLRRCIDNVFTLIPPDTNEIPGRNVLHDAQINIQAFVANVYGSIDNLAWVWLYESGLDGTIHRNRVGLRSKHIEVRASLSASLQTYLQKIDPWLEYLIEYRDALAHRIPLYIPPGGVPTNNVDAYNDLSRRITDALYVLNDGFEYERLSAEQDKLLVFQPLITHSVKETTAHFAFHVQMLADFLTVEELGYKVLDELAGLTTKP